MGRPYTNWAVENNDIPGYLGAGNTGGDNFNKRNSQGKTQDGDQNNNETPNIFRFSKEHCESTVLIVFGILAIIIVVVVIKPGFDKASAKTNLVSALKEQVQIHTDLPRRQLFIFSDIIDNQRYIGSSSYLDALDGSDKHTFLFLSSCASAWTVLFRPNRHRIKSFSSDHNPSRDSLSRCTMYGG
jgi:hypothetical protein